MIARHRRSDRPSAAGGGLARRRLALLAGVGLVPAQGSAGAWTTGGLTFSDELGGTRLVGASGTGTRDDPIILLEEITGAGPAVLVVRNHRTGHLDISPALGFLSALGGQDRRQPGPVGLDRVRPGAHGAPSIRRASTPTGSRSTSRRAFARAAKADRFAQTLQDDEPFDRIRFDGGNVDPQEHLRLDFDIVDVNGGAVFYLVQQPIILLAWHDRPDPPRWLSSWESVP